MEKQGYNGTYTLLDKWFKPVVAGQRITDKWGDVWRLDDASAPNNASSSGRVYVTHYAECYGRTFYPEALELHWAPPAVGALPTEAMAVGSLIVDAIQDSPEIPEGTGRPTVGFGGTDGIESGGGGDFGGGGADASYDAPSSDTPGD
jgi:uncharacterized membrane protein YgcG